MYMLGSYRMFENTCDNLYNKIVVFISESFFYSVESVTFCTFHRVLSANLGHDAETNPVITAFNELLIFQRTTMLFNKVSIYFVTC